MKSVDENHNMNLCKIWKDSELQICANYYTSIFSNIVEDHCDVIPFFRACWRKKLFPSKDLLFIHFDAHPDLAIPSTTRTEVRRMFCLIEAIFIEQLYFSTGGISSESCIHKDRIFLNMIPEGRRQSSGFFLAEHYLNINMISSTTAKYDNSRLTQFFECIKILIGALLSYLWYN